MLDLSAFSSHVVTVFYWSLGSVAAVVAIIFLLFYTRIGSNEVGIVEKLWSLKGSVRNGFIALNREAGFQPEVLRAGIYFLPRFLFKVHVKEMVTVPRGKMAYIFARDGEPLPASQTLARELDQCYYTDVRGFLLNGGQQGQQLMCLREGTHPINLAMFVVIAEEGVYNLDLGDALTGDSIASMQKTLVARNGFDPVIVTSIADPNNPSVQIDQIGIVTVQDGPSLDSGDLIAPLVEGHSSFQEAQKFLDASGRKGIQEEVLLDGTYFINRLFATVKIVPKTTVEVGHAGVVISYIGPQGKDRSGADFHHGELVDSGFRGIQQKALMPGKYPFNTQAGKITQVPTTNVVLKWGEGSGSHGFDENLSEIEMVTKDAFHIKLPLNVVMHIDYQVAPRVIQRFGAVKNLVEINLDPIVSSHFKNVGQNKTILEILQEREAIQKEALDKMGAEFGKYDIALEGLLIGTPHDDSGQMQKLLDQLQSRQIAAESIKTLEQQKTAADTEKELNKARAVAEQQPELTKSEIQIQVRQNEGAAELAKAKQRAEQTVAEAGAARQRMILEAEGRAKQTVTEAEASREKLMLEAQGKAEAIRLEGQAEGEKLAQIGVGEAAGINEKAKAYETPGAQLQLVQNVVATLSSAFRDGNIQLVPNTLVTMGGEGSGDGGENVLTSLLKLLVLNQLGVNVNSPQDAAQSEAVSAILTKVKSAVAEANAQSSGTILAEAASVVADASRARGEETEGGN